LTIHPAFKLVWLTFRTIGLGAEMNGYWRVSAATAIMSVALLTAGPALAAGNAAINALQQTPVSLFSYGLGSLEEGVRVTFVRDSPPPFATFAAPLSGKMADITTVIYAPDADTITINLVKIDKLPDGATSDQACQRGMAALRMYAGLDPASGQLQAGMTSSLLAGGFLATGSPVKAPADDLTTLDKAFRLRFNGQTEQGRFSCNASLFGNAYTLDKK
jgi:hypothetical protein